MDQTSLLLRYTYTGDANLDGSVNVSDFNMLAANFGKTGQFWTSGDFNYDGTVNALDLNAVATNRGDVSDSVVSQVGSALALLGGFSAGAGFGWARCRGVVHVFATPTSPGISKLIEFPDRRRLILVDTSN